MVYNIDSKSKFNMAALVYYVAVAVSILQNVLARHGEVHFMSTKENVLSQLMTFESPRYTATERNSTVHSIFGKVHHIESQSQSNMMLNPHIYDFVSTGSTTEGALAGPSSSTGKNLVWYISGEYTGTPYDRPILIAGHYDTHPHSPGVSSSSSNIVAMLETTKHMVENLNSTCHRFSTVYFLAYDLGSNGTAGLGNFLNNEFQNVILKGDVPVGNFQGAFILRGVLNWDENSNSQNMDEATRAAFPSDAEEFDIGEKKGDSVISFYRTTDQPIIQNVTSRWENMRAPRYAFGTLAFPFGGRPSLNLEPDSAVWNFPGWGAAGVFWDSELSQDGLKAVLFTDTNGMRSYMRECYGKPCDDISQVNEPRQMFLAKIIEMLTWTATNMTVSGENCLPNDAFHTQSTTSDAGISDSGMCETQTQVHINFNVRGTEQLHVNVYNEDGTTQNTDPVDDGTTQYSKTEEYYYTDLGGEDDGDGDN